MTPNPTGTIDLTNGVFDWEVIKGKIPMPGFKGRDRIKIKFTPKNPPVTCNNIRLIQVVKWEAYDSAGDLITTDISQMYVPLFFKKSKFGHREKDHITHEGHVYVLDYRSCESEPYYNGDSVKGYVSQGKATPLTPTTLTDGPSTPLTGNVLKPNIKKIIKRFETCAICVDTGKILGCIKWQSTMTKTPVDNGTIDVETGGSDDSTDSFKKALKQFVKTHALATGTQKFWTCVQTGKKGRKISDGTVLPPITGGFNDTWKSVGLNSISIDKEFIGIAESYEHLENAIGNAITKPLESAVKFTWSGEQDKDIISVVLSPIEEITSADISPFVIDDEKFENDLTRILVTQTSIETFSNLIIELCKFEKEKNGENDFIYITLMTNIHNKIPIGFTHTLKPEELDVVLKNISDLKLNENEKEVFNYLWLNMSTKDFISFK